MNRLPLVLSVLALVLGLFAVLRPTPPTTVPPSAAVHADHVEGTEEVEVAVHMGRIQRYHQKLWSAGQAGNAELAAFYLHEMEEAMELITAARLKENGVDVSALMSTYGLKTVGRLEGVLENEGVGAMHDEAATLVNACNGCHVATGRAFIRIQVPTTVSYPDQDFAPAAK